MCLLHSFLPIFYSWKGLPFYVIPAEYRAIFKNIPQNLLLKINIMAKNVTFPLETTKIVLWNLL